MTSKNLCRAANQTNGKITKPNHICSAVSSNNSRIGAKRATKIHRFFPIARHYISNSSNHFKNRNRLNFKKCSSRTFRAIFYRNSHTLIRNRCGTRASSLDFTIAEVRPTRWSMNCDSLKARAYPINTRKNASRKRRTSIYPTKTKTIALNRKTLHSLLSLKFK